MRTVTNEQLRLIVNVCIRNLCKEQAEKKLSLSEEEAESFGAFNETALEEQEKDKFYEDFVVKCFAQSEDRENYGEK